MRFTSLTKDELRRAAQDADDDVGRWSRMQWIFNADMDLPQWITPFLNKGTPLLLIDYVEKLRDRARELFWNTRRSKWDHPFFFFFLTIVWHIFRLDFYITCDVFRGVHNFTVKVLKQYQWVPAGVIKNNTYGFRIQIWGDTCGGVRELKIKAF